MGSISKNYNKRPRLVSKTAYIFRFGVPGEKLFQNTPHFRQMRGILMLFFYIDPEQLLKTGFLHDFDGKKGLLEKFFAIDPIMNLMPNINLKMLQVITLHVLWLRRFN